MLVGYSPGGQADALARIIGKQLGREPQNIRRHREPRRGQRHDRGQAPRAPSLTDTPSSW